MVIWWVSKPDSRYKNLREKKIFTKAVQVAITETLTSMEKKNPEKRAILVTFNHDVTVVGDGKEPKILIQDEDLESKTRLHQITQRTPVYENIGRHQGKLRNQVLQ